MNESTFKTALSAISSDEYGTDDIKAVKKWLEELKSKESAVKRRLEQDKNNYVKKKEKTSSELREIRGKIKSINNILKNTKGDR